MVLARSRMRGPKMSPDESLRRADFAEGSRKILEATEDVTDLPVRLRFSPMCSPDMDEAEWQNLVALQSLHGRRWYVEGIKFMIDGSDVPAQCFDQEPQRFIHLKQVCPPLWGKRVGPSFHAEFVAFAAGVDGVLESWAFCLATAEGLVDVDPVAFDADLGEQSNVDGGVVSGGAAPRVPDFHVPPACWIRTVQ